MSFVAKPWLLGAAPLLLLLPLGCCTRTTGGVLATAALQGMPGEAVSVELRLSNWGVEELGALKYLKLGLHRGVDGLRLRVHDVRSMAPPIVPSRGSRFRQPPLSEGLFVIGQLKSGEANALGGYFAPFSRTPSAAALTIAQAPGGGRALRLSFSNRAPGYAGLWIHLFDSTLPDAQRVYLDVRGARFLTFEVRGEKGGEQLSLKFADRHWETRQDALLLAGLERFVSSGRISAAWQRVWVPFEALPAALDKRQLASLVIAAATSASGRIYLRNLALAAHRGVAFPRLPPPVKRPGRPLRKALWVWETGRFLTRPKAVSRLLAFCREQGVTEVFLQLPDAAKQGLPWDIASMAPLVRALHSAGIHVDALDGHPRLALASEHHKVLTTIRAIIRYNKNAPPRERFDGIRYDNEVYLLPAFSGVHKARLLREYLGLLRSSRALTRGTLRFGVDMPFWFDGREPSGQWAFAIDDRPLSEHVIDLADNVAIMDYRTSAYGPDGVLAHARSELIYAAKKSKQLFIALETVRLPDEQQLTFQPARQCAGKKYHAVLEALGPGRARLTVVDQQAWAHLSPRLANAKGGGRVLCELRRVLVPAAKQTFHPLGGDRMREVMGEVRRELQGVPSFAGFAIHAYKSASELLRPPSTAR